jgi:RHS repeat-associated protein
VSAYLPFRRTVVGHGQRRWVRRVAGVTAGLAAVPMLSAAGMAPRWDSPKPPAQHLVPVHRVYGHPAHLPPMRNSHPPVAHWPAAASAQAELGSAPAITRPGGLPVQLELASGQTRAAASVRVAVAPRTLTTTLGVRGVVLTLTPAEATAATTRVQLQVDYQAFAYAYEGDYAARLRLVTLPACALSTPGRPACRVQTALRSTDDVRTSRVSAPVVLGAAARNRDLVVALTSSPSGSGGNYAASPLPSAGSWQGGNQSGAFDYSYPISVPPVPGGLEPQVSLDYNSQQVDGLTSATDNQASWIGDGWDYSPGYIERDYQSCETEPPGATNWQQSGDFCWSKYNAVTLSLGGQDTTLVEVGTSGTWHAETDQDERISYQTSGPTTSNGTADNGYWVVTEPDGTKYYFGLSELPGWSSGDATTDSAWTMPVFATSSGQPCYNTDFTKSYCGHEAWRWNLDYVVDPHGNAVAYFYDTETNDYARDNGTTADSPYTQAGALTKIEYGLQSNAIYAKNGAAAEVDFTVDTTSRTDVPTDLACSSGSSCNVVSPTFWGHYQLTTISTESLESSSLQPVDSWSLAQSYPPTNDPSTPPSLWLASIAHTGQDGGSITLNKTTFGPTPLPNRVDLTDGYSDITRMRLGSITNETGGVISINYDTVSSHCTTGNLPTPDNNTQLCYPAWWNPGSGIFEDWFNKYVVVSVDEDDTTGAKTPVVTNYSYGGAAWHYDDSALTPSKYRTWDQWRGYQTVTTETGASPDPITKDVATYFQGMNGDYKATKTVTLTSTRQDVVTDSNQYAGMEFEDITYNGDAQSAPEVTDTITLPWTSAATATESQPSPLPSLSAYLTGTSETKVYTALAGNGTREADTTYTHDSYGRVTTASSVPDTTDPAEDTCTTTAYASSTSAWIMNLPAEVTDVAVPCGTTPVLPKDAVSDKLTFYDGATTLAGDTPAQGNVTMTQLATSYTGTTPVYTTESQATYDAYGRVLTATDADNRTTTTAYTPATGAEPTAVSVTDPMGLVTTTTYDPARELPLVTTAPAGTQTTETYDALGRLTAVYQPDHSPEKKDPDVTYTYTVSNSLPSVTTTSTVNTAGGYSIAQTLYDSLGRAIETQTETSNGDDPATATYYTSVTDTYYNSDGWKVLVSNPYATSGMPSGTLVAAVSSQVPSQTAYVYDSDGRVIRQIADTDAKETSETDTSYGGDYSTVTYQNMVAGEPDGGTPETTFLNGEGKTSAIYQYHAGVPADPADPASDYDNTTYSYTPAGQLAGIQDADGNTWSYGYDPEGDQTTATDPDAGTTTSTYDPAGQVMSVTDARSDQTSYTYDADGRKTAEYDTTGGAGETTADELASWTYDTLAKGLPTSSTSYADGLAFTTAVTRYDAYGLPVSVTTTIPTSQTVTGDLAGSYSVGYGYNAYTEGVAYLSYSAAGPLPSETLTYVDTPTDQPYSLAVQNGPNIATSVNYTGLGQPDEYNLGGTPQAPDASLTQTYDLETGETQETTATIDGTSPSTVDDTTYSYDNAGNITSEADTPADGPAQVQCYQYDYLGRLHQAWSQSTATCATSPSRSAEGGAAPYWDTYTYNDINNLTSNVSTPPTGAATTTTESYPAAGSAQPHAPASTQVSGPGGTTSTNYTYNDDGDTTKITSSSSTQKLNWNDAGQLASVTATGQNAGTTSYIYDASGNLLLQTDPASTTLYLPDEQLTDTGGTLTGTRYYSLNGQTIAARTSASQLYWLDGDTQGTMTLAINATTDAVTRRYYDPYGNPIGTPPSTWPGSQGFVGGTTDPATGLTDLGAREYNPASGTFISPDPLIDPGDPQDLNAYAYATDNPTTDEDPTGAMWTPPPGGYNCPPDCSGSDPTPGGTHHTGSTPGGGSDTGTGTGPYVVVHQNNAGESLWDLDHAIEQVTISVVIPHITSTTAAAAPGACDTRADSRYTGCNPLLPPPTYTGGWKSFLAGLIVGPLDAIDPSNSQLFNSLAQDLGAQTSPGSWFAAGTGTTDFLTLALGGSIDAAAGAASTVDDEGSTILSYSTKIRGQMGLRGWTEESVEETVNSPVETYSVWDYTTGDKQPATAYAAPGGGYVVVNDETGQVVQVSDANNPNWKPVWNDPRFQR